MPDKPAKPAGEATLIINCEAPQTKQGASFKDVMDAQQQRHDDAVHLGAVAEKYGITPQCGRAKIPELHVIDVPEVQKALEKMIPVTTAEGLPLYNTHTGDPAMKQDLTAVKTAVEAVKGQFSAYVTESGMQAELNEATHTVKPLAVIMDKPRATTTR